MIKISELRNGPGWGEFMIEHRTVIEEEGIIVDRSIGIVSMDDSVSRKTVYPKKRIRLLCSMISSLKVDEIGR